MHRATYILGKGSLERIYGADERRDIAALVSVGAPLPWRVTRERAEAMA